MSESLRNTPVQERSRNRLEELTVAARRAVEEHGVLRFTTDHVARNAGVSIGTVYRYFPDRVAVLNHLYPNLVITLEPSAADPEVVADVLNVVRSQITNSKVPNPRERIRNAIETIESSGIYAVEDDNEPAA